MWPCWPPYILVFFFLSLHQILRQSLHLILQWNVMHSYRKPAEMTLHISISNSTIELSPRFL